MLSGGLVFLFELDELIYIFDCVEIMYYDFIKHLQHCTKNEIDEHILELKEWC